MLRTGAVLGEMSMFDGEPRYASCWALSEVEAAVLDRAAVARLIQARPEIGAKLLVKLTQLLAQRLRNTSSQLVKVLRRQVALSRHTKETTMFQALVLEKNPEFRAAVREVDDGFLPEGDVTVDDRVLHPQLQGRPGHHQQVAGGAQLADGGRHRRLRHGGWRAASPQLEGRATPWCSTASASARRTRAAWPARRG